jgi:hypothetical protein
MCNRDRGLRLQQPPKDPSTAERSVSSAAKRLSRRLGRTARGARLNVAGKVSQRVVVVAHKEGVATKIGRRRQEMSVERKKQWQSLVCVRE